MDEAIPLLDTPKRKSIQLQADALRASLKDFERNFAAANNGRKPSKDDIKADAAIAAKYRDYNKVRDVLSGKLGLDALNGAPPRRKNEHTRRDSAISLTPRRPRHTEHTPSKATRLHPNEIDPYDAPSSASPKVMLSAIGPTPRRDGTVLGIFDLLPRSGSTARTTTSHETLSSRKRKIDLVFETQDGDRGVNLAAVAQTPSQRPSKRAGKVAEQTMPPTTTPRSCMKTGRRQHSKTPVSEGKRFMLNHFFATPSAVRFVTMIDAEDGDAANVHVHAAKTPVQGGGVIGSSKTPLRDTVLGLSPSKSEAGADATPPYLKRSFSFKERLLSASASSSVTTSSAWKRATSPNSSRAGPRALRHAKFGPKPLSQMIADLQSQNQSEQGDEHDDDLDALRELEFNEVNVLVNDSQANEYPAQADDASTAEPLRTWKKKGQKRTTRRVIMRPVRLKPADPPSFVAADDDEDGEDDEDELALDHKQGDERDTNGVSRVEETQPDFSVMPERPEPGSDADSDLDYLIAEAEQDDEDEFLPDKEPTVTLQRKRGSAKTRKNANPNDVPGQPVTKTRGKKGSAKNGADEAVTRTINPNAYSHMNFRSLKIKNKNSKAKGRGRFGRGRR